MESKTKIFWWIVSLVTLTFSFWLYFHGVFHEIWEKDISFISFFLIGAFAICNYLSFYIIGLFKRDRDKSIAIAKTLSFVSNQFVNIGLLGTVVGLIVSTNVFISASSGVDVSQLLSQIGPAIGTSLYTTGVGIVTSIILKIQLTSYSLFVESQDESKSG